MNILYLFDRELWDHKTHRVREMWAYALGDHAADAVEVWGPGWDGWDTSLGADDNITRYPFDPDAVILYGVDQEHNPRGIRAPKVLMFTDANHPATQQTLDDIRPDLTVFTHPQDVGRWAVPGRIAVLHHCVLVDLYGNRRPIVDRPIHSLVAGRCSSPTYMLRGKFAALIRDRKIAGGIRPHPGDRLRSRAAAWMQLEDYADELSRARLFLTCCGRFGYFYQKYLEAWAAGCVVIGSRPNDPDFARDFGDCLVEVSVDADERTIIDTVEGTLRDTVGMQQRIDAAQASIRRSYTMEHYATRLHNAIKDVL